MTTSTEWLALAERARKAKGPDREIDALLDIAARVGHPGHNWLHKFKVWRVKSPGRAEAVNAQGEVCGSWYSDEYTSSIDAIVALIEKEFPGTTRLCGFIQSDDADAENPPGAWANIFPPGIDSNDGELFFVEQCETEATAYVTSFCLAKAAQAKEQENG